MPFWSRSTATWRQDTPSWTPALSLAPPENYHPEHPSEVRNRLTYSPGGQISGEEGKRPDSAPYKMCTEIGSVVVATDGLGVNFKCFPRQPERGGGEWVVFWCWWLRVYCIYLSVTAWLRCKSPTRWRLAGCPSMDLPYIDLTDRVVRAIGGASVVIS